MPSIVTQATTSHGPLNVVQDAEYAGEEWWRWSIRLDGAPAVLDDIAAVVYRLHPTFPKPVREVRDREHNFRLDAAGWGTFTVHLRVRFRDGTEDRLRHELELYYPDGRPAEQ